MLDETFAEAIAHKPTPLVARICGYSGHVVLGQRLRPFSFWHAANLDFIQSPFVGAPGKIDFTALYLAAKCCQLRYPDTIATQRSKFNQQTTTGRFGRQFASDPLFRSGELAKFSIYLTDYMTCGPIHAAAEGQKPIKIPWYLYYAALLVKKAGYTKTEAWNAPVAESQWWVTALIAAEGAEVDVLTPQDRKDLASAGIEI